MRATDPVSQRAPLRSTLLHQWVTLDLSEEYRNYRGSFPAADSQSGRQIHFSPRLEWPLGNNTLILVRADIPLYRDPPFWELYPTHPLWQPNQDYADLLLRQSPEVTPDSGKFVHGHDHMAEMTLDLAYGRVAEHGAILLLGARFVVPTSEDQSNSKHQLLFGPDLAWVTDTHRGQMGTRITHVLNLTRGRSFITRETSMQLLYTHSLTRRWAIIANPTVTYDWAGSPDNRLLLPLGGGVRTIIPWGQMSIQLTLEAYHYIKTADRFGVKNLVKLSFRPLKNDQSASIW